MTAGSRLQAVLEWLRAGYPGGVPGPDRVPLLSLLRTTPLTEDEIREVVREVSAFESGQDTGHRIDEEEIQRFIADVAHHEANPEDLSRVAGRLAAAGWPLAGMRGDEDWSGDADPRG